MTDKQIIIDKDKFVEAENEPINHEAVNKFIEETDKFYIDGVDVSGCEDRYLGWDNSTCQNTGNSCPDLKCENNPNCYYKQLKAKEQECEELKEQLDTISREAEDFDDEAQEIFTEKTNLEIELKEQKQQLDQLKQTLTEIKNIADEMLQTKIPFCTIHEKIIEKINEAENEG